METPLTQRQITRYITLQAGSLAFCWGWFAGLWAMAFFGFSMGDFEWWILVASACAGLYGLRPNLERAIDSAYLKGLRTPQALSERASQLRPIKRRIDLAFSVLVLLFIVVVTALWLGGVFSVASSGGRT